MDRTRNDELLTVKEAAALLKMSTVTVSRWLKQGRLVGYRVGARSIRLRRLDVEALLEPTQTEVTDEEVAQREEVIRRLNERHAEMLRARGGKPMASSVDLIREDRERDSFVRYLPPLTDEEVAQLEEASRRSDELSERIYREHGCRIMPSSVDLIREDRERNSFEI
jgi:excisionase family DNA binding protein